MRLFWIYTDLSHQWAFIQKRFFKQTTNDMINIVTISRVKSPNENEVKIQNSFQ